MALVGFWGCYIHIPKTGGVFTKHVLWTKEPGYNDGDRHGLPRKWAYNPIWAVVRDPAEWLHSAYHHRIRENWSDPAYRTLVPWLDYCHMTDRYGKEVESFDEFFWNITRHVPGVVSWYFQSYMPPPVQAVRLPELNDYLAGLGCHVDLKPKNTDSKPSELTETHRKKIRETESYMYERWKL